METITKAKRERGGARRAEGLALAGLWLFTAASVAGYATFGLNPSLVARVPGAADVYADAFTFFPRVQIWLGWLVLAGVLVLRTGWRWLPAFVVVYALSLGAELAGTTFGVPFGEYAYRPALGISWLERVPVLIPLSWFYMALPAYGLAVAAFGDRLSARIVMGSVLLAAWDLSLDPAMSYLTSYWVWGESGSFYGMPWVNLLGWLGTSAVLMAALEGLGAARWIGGVPVGWLAGYYGAHLFVSLGMVVAGGLWGAVWASVAVYGACAAAAAVAAVTRRHPVGARGGRPARSLGARLTGMRTAGSAVEEG